MDKPALADDILILLEGQTNASQDEVIQILEQKFHTLANASPVLFWMSDTSKGCNWFNQNWLDFRGRSLEEEYGNQWAQGVHPEDFQHCLDIYTSHFDQRLPFSMEYRLQRYDGVYRWFIDQGLPRYDHQDNFIGYIGSLLDITELKERDQELRLAASVFEHSQEGIMITDRSGVIVKINQAFTKITGFGGEVIGKRPNVLKSERHSPSFYNAMWEQLLSEQFWRGEVWNRRANGEIYPESLSISAVCDDQGNVQNYVGLFSDISRRKAHENELEHRANHDHLTSLPNRSLLQDRLMQAIIHARRSKLPLIVACIDLDGFKEINDNLGHHYGDRVLIHIAESMKAFFRNEDTIARYGGDEFILVMPDSGPISENLPRIERLLLKLAEPFIIEGCHLKVSASIGLTSYPQAHHVDAKELIRQADTAMYRAKKAGRNRYHIFQSQE